MGGLVTTWRRALVLADQLDATAAAGADPTAPRPLPAVWAGCKLALIALASPLLGVWVGSRAAVNHRRMKALTTAFPAMLDDVLAGRPTSFPVARVARVDAGARWFISSDLHRMPPGRLDWPARQGAASLYDGALDHYAAQGWGLIENGDIEDYWLVGGSAYGVVYDIARMVAGVLPGGAGAALGRAVATEHLRRIVDHYRPTVERVRDGFHAPGRFVRVTGNHDDVYEDPVLAGLLGTVFPGLAPVDFVVLADGDQPVGLVFHGHQTDGWNGPAVPNLVARFTTSLASALHDQPLEALAPGLPRPVDTLHLLQGRARNRLTRVNGLTGATTGLDSLDEVLLFEACRRRWGQGPGPDLDGGPWIILGHTHIPLLAPRSPADGGRWSRYANSGSGITYELVTGVEWDGTADPRSPEVHLVGWVPGAGGGVRRVVLDVDPAEEDGVRRGGVSPAGPARRGAAPPPSTPAGR